MSKVRSISQLQNLLDNELSWRIKEFSYLKRIVQKSDAVSQPVALRSSLPLLYAHWEAFIKNSSTHYLKYVNEQSVQIW